MDNIRLIFVLPEKYDTEKEVSEIMIQAYETCKQNVRTDVTWVKEDNFDSLTVNKTDFVIFEDFKGDLFENLKETKCARILGPWAISICLMDEKPIPNYPWPIYNVAMYECIIACSNLPKIKKLEIKERVEIMGGCYVDTLVEKVTHLITDSPKSEKYYAAAEAGVKLMCSSWIEAVWETSQSTNVHANDKEFEEHKCLPFQNLNICCTGLLDVQRKELERVIKKNGGKYSAKLRLTEADFLVCAGVEGSMSEKYKAARKRSNIYCVDISWVTESVAKGYSLPHHLFPVKKATSTPTKGGQYLNPDFSILSAISIANISSEKAGVDSTVNATLRNSPAGFASPKPGPSKRKGNLKEDYGQLVDSLDIKKAKKAGQYLDGCSVYITGFSPDHAEKLCKILNLSGATRYDQFSERVTHVIVGDPKFYEVKLIQSKHSQCAVVSVEWLLDSIEKLQPVSEEQYLLSISDINKTDFTSPLSKKGLNLLRTDRTVTRVEAEEAQTAVSQEEDKAETDIIQQYLKRGNTVQEEDDTLAQLLKNADNLSDLANKVQDQPKEPVEFKPAETSTQRTSMSLTQDETSASQMFFEGLKFLVTGFEENHFEYMRDIIEGSCGDVVSKNYKGIPDFVVVPVFNQCELRYTATEIVNDLFINECAKEGGLLSDICYYHRPLNLPDATPLENCVITISGYSSYERNFLKILIEGLGGRHQEQFSRVTSHSRAVVASTHLISDKPSGKKYQAALKWGLPVLTKDWLLECAKTGTRVSEDDHVVEDNNDSPSENIPLIDRKSSCATPKNNISNAGASASKVDSVTSTSAATPSSAAEQVNTFSAMSCLEKINTPGTPVDMQRPRSSGILTPLNQRFPRTLHFSDSAEKPFSQATPVNKILQQYRESNAELSPCRDTPEKFLWEGIKTPDTPLGACICDPPSPNLRKQCELWLRQFPDFKPPPRYRRLSTPLSEIKRRLWDKILKSVESPPLGEAAQSQSSEKGAEEMEVDEPKELPVAEDSTQNRLIHNRLQQLEEMLSASNEERRQSRNFQSTIPIPEGNKEFKDSQAYTVGWDYTEREAEPPKMKIFILSGIADSVRSAMVRQLESLGASVSDLSNYDPSSTHLLCPKPARNEKTLSCMAAGKWILHTSYLDKSLEAGHFLNEEEYEFGNPKSAGKFPIEFDKDTESRMKSMHWWRKEVARRGYGAFNDMRAIVVAQKRDPIIRCIEAGGGVVIDVSPPFDDTVYATHCLLEQRIVRDYADYIPLAQQGIYLLNTVYISDYLYNPHRDIRECILPYFAKYYSRS